MNFDAHPAGGTRRMGPGKYPIDTMRKSERIRNEVGSLMGGVAAASLVLAFLAAAPRAHELKEVSLLTAGGQTHLKLGFSPNGSEGDYPLYFQKTDMEKGTITLSFLETESAYPLGRHPLDGKAPEIAEILLKKITSPSGKSFLGVELKLKQPPTGDVPVQAAPKGVLKVMLGKGKGKFAWSLAKSLKAEDAYLAAGATAPPPGAGKPKLSPEAAAMEAMAREGGYRPEPVTPEVPTEPGIPRSEPSAPESQDAGVRVPSAKLLEMRLTVTAAQENLSLDFNPPAAPDYTHKKNAKDSTWLELTLDGVASGLAKKEYAFPKGSVFKRVKVNKLEKGLQLRIQLAPKEEVQIAPQDGGLALSGLGKGGAAPAFKWTSLKPEGMVGGEVVESRDAAKAAGQEAGEPLKSAHQEGEALETRKAGAGGVPGKGLSSGKIFSLGQGSKTMVLLRDSASLKTAPGEKGKLIRKIPVGEKVEKIENQGASLRVVSGADTGFIRAADAAFEDELTPVQEKGIRDRIDAKAAKLAAAEAKAAAAAAKEQARLAAAAAKEEARIAAAAAKEAEKARKADELAKKKADADAAKEAAKLAAQQKAQGLLEAQAQARAGAAKQVGAEQANTSQEGASRPSAGGPKLAIADNPELADKLAQEKLAAEEEKKRVEPEENRIAYNSYGRRDPFIPVEQGASDVGIDIDQMKVVGIIWESQQPMAILEHNRESGVSFTIKEGDPVHNGRVARISRDAVTFDISEYGISRSYSLKLVSSKEGAKK